MNTGKYSLLEILEFTNLDQLVVPEIQRDYVWDVNDVLDLLETIKDGFEGEKGNIPYLGFIYAYNDRDYPYKYFLVDGQQRMTSLYLLLLTCHQKLKKKLPDYLVKNGRLKFDYKVRQATHDFLTDLVKHCQNNTANDDFKIEDQVWYHKDYQNDRTISNIILNYASIKEWLNQFTQDKLTNFLKFVEDKVELSYFDVENGREGEELYIYMNSRGRHLEANETLKAKFLTKVTSEQDRLTWGKKWEDWQDFFWKHRGNSPDADAGFNEFLRMIQITNMCDLGRTSAEVVTFASGKRNEKLNIDLLPNTLEEVEEYFQAYKWLVESEKVINFLSEYEENEFLTTTKDRSQIDYLRILPILGLLTKTGLRDEEVVVRFIRFFYNVARKENVGKDIAGQLPIAVKLILEYGKGNTGECDVCDLLDYQKGRTTLIDEEEVLKLSLYKTPPDGLTRQELEGMFWKAEDHFIFNGEIKFLLNEYFDKGKRTIDLSNYKKTWSSLKTLFPSRNNANNGMISRALSYYGNTWVQDTPYYYNNYNCQAWYELVRTKAGEYLLALLDDMHGKTCNYLDIIIKRKAKRHFELNQLTSINSLKAENTLFGQVQILAAIDYYSEKILWKSYGYIAHDVRYTYEGDKPFFTRDRVIHNIERYIKDGFRGRVIPMMNDVLSNEAKLKQILTDILSFNE